MKMLCIYCDKLWAKFLVNELLYWNCWYKMGTNHSKETVLVILIKSIKNVIPGSEDRNLNQRSQYVKDTKNGYNSFFSTVSCCY